MQAQFLRRFFAPAAIILAFAVSTFLAPLAATASEVPEVRCQVFDAPVPGFDYRQAIGIAGESPNSRHVITTYYNRLAGGRQFHFWTNVNRGDPLDNLARTIEAASRGAGVPLPTITTRGPTTNEIPLSDIPSIGITHSIPESIRRALYECDGALVLFVASVESIPLGGSQVSDRQFIDQAALAEGAVEVARREFAPDFTTEPPKKSSSSSGGTIAAIGGAALVAGGLTWLLWPDTKSTIQPWVQGRNDGLGYAAGVQMRVTPRASIRLYQTDGPTELRFTGIRWELRW